VGALRWANHPKWGNSTSSWHVTIDDRIQGPVGDIWAKADRALLELFPVPTIIMADFRYGTWHGNWTNDSTIGVENRNSGYSGKSKLKGGIRSIGKTSISVNSKDWEEYTRDQMVCNVNIGRMVNGLYKIDPDWVLTHQCVWWPKLDTGPAFPIHDLRSSVMSETPVTELQWLDRHPDAEGEVDDSLAWEQLVDFRNEVANEFVVWAKPHGEHEGPEGTAAQLYRLGFNTGPEMPENLSRHVRWFQRSTSKTLKLATDGIAGPKTNKAIADKIARMDLG